MSLFLPFLAIGATVLFCGHTALKTVLEEQNMGFTTKSVFCCYTCYAQFCGCRKAWNYAGFGELFHKNETTLYFFVDSFGGADISSVQTSRKWGFIQIDGKNVV